MSGGLKLPTSLYGRSLAKQKKSDNVGGNNDIAAAKKSRPDVDDEFTRYGSIICSPQQLERRHFAGLGAASARCVDGCAAATEGSSCSRSAHWRGPAGG